MDQQQIQSSTASTTEGDSGLMSVADYAIRFFQWLFAGCVGAVYFAVIEPDGQLKTQYRFRPPHDWPAIVNWAQGWSAAGYNVFFCPLTQLLDSNGARCEEAAFELPAFFADIDLDNPAEHKAAYEKLVATGCVSTFIWSGAGFHPYGKLQQPLRITEENREQVKGLLYAYGSGLNEVVHGERRPPQRYDLASLLRVPGTTNYPNATKRAKDRVPAQTFVCAYSDAIVPVDSLQDWRERYRRPGASFDSSSTVHRGGEKIGAPPPDWYARLQKDPILKGYWDKTRQLLGPDPSMSAYALAIANRLVREYRDADEQILAAMDAFYKHHARTKPREALVKTLEKARATAEEKRDQASTVEQAGSTLAPLEVASDQQVQRTNVDPHLTDMGNACRLAERHGHDLRYCRHLGGWLAWDDRRWTRDLTGEVERRAKDTVLHMYSQAKDLQDEDRRTALAEHAVKSESEARIRNMIKLAESEFPIPATADQFDADPWSLNVLNGTINLRTRELRPHRREDLFTKLAPVAYDPHATYPTWLSFLYRVLAGKPDLIAFVQRVIGYSLTGDVSEHAIFLLHGTGANGKTTLLTTVQSMLGDYAKQAAPELLLAKTGESHPTGVADLFGSRFVASTEVDKGKWFAEALVKQLTGGDRVKARFMHKDFFEFDPTHKIFLAANHKPIIRGSDHAIWRRIRLIPFTVTIPDADQDKALSDKLRAELPGILTWAVDGCIAWQREGLGASLEVQHATEDYRAEMDVLGDFIDACCNVGAGVRTTARDLYSAYKAWCESNDEEAMTQKAFGSTLADRGFIRDRTDHRKPTMWRGIGPREERVSAA